MKKIIYTTVILALIVGFNGCAKRPSSISASHVSHERYSHNSCTQLNAKMADARYKLTEVSGKQNTKANVDAAGVLLLGLPISALSGDYEGEVARYKGEVQAIETAQIRRGCKG